VRQKFNQPLTNTSNLLLETDLLRFEKQRELWNTILNRWEALLAELLEARLTPEALTPPLPGVGGTAVAGSPDGFCRTLLHH
jgi:hypothetical protein